MDHRQTVVACSLDGDADLGVLAALMRLQLADLLALSALALVLDPVRQAEAGEERCCVEEVVEVDHPTF